MNKNIRRRPNFKRKPNFSTNALGQIRRYKYGFNDDQNEVRDARNYKSTISVNRLGNGMPDELYLNLVYANQFTIGTSVNQYAFYYEANNPYDPDPQLGGESAREYGNLAPLYRYCRTYGSSITLDFNIISGVSIYGVVAPVLEQNGLTYTLVTTLPRAIKGKPVSLSGITNCRIKNSANTAAIMGVDNLDYSLEHTFDIDNGPQPGSTVVEPSQKWFWINYFTAAAGQTGINISGTVKITYKCRFSRKKWLDTLQENADVTDPTSQPDMIVEGNTRFDDAD